VMAALRRIGELAPRMADAISGKDLPRFGTLIAQAWELNKQLDPDSSNEQVEAILERIAAYAYGAKLLGAGGGGFLFVACRCETDAKRLRESLESDPPNPRARFFDFQISDEGLVVTVC
jgi:fucokinase